MTNTFRSCLLSVFVICATMAPIARADVRLPGFFSDHMVLQQQTPLRIWGWADAGESVTVTIAGNSQTATTSDDGRWEVRLPELMASKEPTVLSVQGKNSLQINDVLVGEVWLCSGQSNMEWTVRSSSNAKNEVAEADWPMIRHMKVAHRPSTTPIDDIPTQWQLCSPETVGNFTACGYFMARHLHKELDVPIGLVNSSWGGTRVEPWTPPIGFEKVDAVQDIFQSVIGRTPGSAPFRDRLSTYIESTEQWLADAKRSIESGSELKPSPPFPPQLTPFESHQDPTMLYNGMIHALVGFPIRGAIWYQGESNHTEGMLYFEKKKALIGGWRELWQQGDFPFYFVQIAPYQYGSEDPKVLAKFWEAQAAVEQVANTGMVIINDIATLNNIHPPNKQDVGKRLALLALKHDYGREDVIAHSPSVASVVSNDSTLRVTFKGTGGGLKTRDGQPPTHFEIVGAGSGGYKPAIAKIDGDSIVLSSPDVNAPTAVRFAWHKLAEPNLTGATGLPVGAFRGGKEPDFASLLPIGDTYRLVYDLDLNKLSSTPAYSVDNSDSIQAFDRVAYLLELSSSTAGDQRVFVSFDAFTDNVNHIGIPTFASGASFQTKVNNAELFLFNNSSLQQTSPEAVNIEFWPNNYGPQNDGNVPGAVGHQFDFGDVPGPPADGYGSMQIHDTAGKKTIFSINHWNAGAGADIGIGNSGGPHRDWTFTANASTYDEKRLRVYVRPE